AMPPHMTAPRLTGYGRAKRFLRATWLLMAGVILLHVIASLSYLLVRFQQVCDSCLLQPAHVRELQALGFSPSHIAFFLVALAALFALVYFTVGAVLYWYGRDDRMALFAAVALVTFGGTAFGEPADALTPVLPPWRATITVLLLLGR